MNANFPARLAKKRIGQLSNHLRLGLGPKTSRTNDDDTPHHLIQSTPFSSSAISSPDRGNQLRPSASLVIIKPLQSVSPDGFNYQTLLIQRHPSQTSFSSAHVFPGGNLDPDDKNYHLLVKRESVQRKTLGDLDEMHASLKICAIRETFEECGILIGLSPPSSNLDSILPKFRQELKDSLVKFSTILQSIQTHNPDIENGPANFFCLDHLTHFANILTPVVLNKRWDTHFYLTVLPPPLQKHSGRHNQPHYSSADEPENTMYQAVPDGSEVVSSVWLTPAQALNRCAQDSSQVSDGIMLPPPQYYLLADLANCKDYRRIIEGTPRIVPPFTPEMVKLSCESTATSALTLPGDPLHSSFKSIFQEKPVDPQSFKHRIHIQTESGAPNLHSGKFFRPLHVERVGIYNIFGTGWEDLS